MKHGITTTPRSSRNAGLFGWIEGEEFQVEYVNHPSNGYSFLWCERISHIDNLQNANSLERYNKNLEKNICLWPGRKFPFTKAMQGCTGAQSPVTISLFPKLRKCLGETGIGTTYELVIQLDAYPEELDPSYNARGVKKFKNHWTKVKYFTIKRKLHLLIYLTGSHTFKRWQAPKFLFSIKDISCRLARYQSELKEWKNRIACDAMIILTINQNTNMFYTAVSQIKNKPK